MFAIDKKSLRTMSIITITICIIYVLCTVVYKEITDDLFFSTALSRHSLHDILSIRYNTWSGRIFIEALLMLTINIPFFPQILISLCCLLLAYGLVSLSIGKDRTSTALVALSLVLILCDFHTNRQATLWITGAYNYILPISIGIYAISIFIEGNSSKFRKSLSCVIVFIACNNEQFAVTAIIGISVYVFARFKNKDLSRYDIFFLLSMLCGGAIVLAAPGNVIRLHAEILSWMPDFNNYSLLDKLSIGVDRISNQINFNDNLLFNACCIISLIYLLRRDRFCVCRLAMITVLLVKTLTFMLSFYPDSLATRALRFEEYISPASWSYPFVYIAYLVNLVALSSILMSCLLASRSSYEAIKISLIMVCGVLSALMIGFSPTAYASGTRVMFIFDLSIVAATLFLLNKLQERGENQVEAVH